MASHAPLDAAAGGGVAPPVPPLTDAGVDAALRRAAKAREMAPRSWPEGPYDGETLVVLLADDVDDLARELRHLRAELGQLHVLGCETTDERDRLRGIPCPVDLPDDPEALRAIVRGLDVEGALGEREGRAVALRLAAAKVRGSEWSLRDSEERGYDVVAVQTLLAAVDALVGRAR